MLTEAINDTKAVQNRKWKEVLIKKLKDIYPAGKYEPFTFSSHCFCYTAKASVSFYYSNELKKH